MADKADKSTTYGIGLDIGTMNLVSARRTPEGKIAWRRMRDVFLDLPLSAKKMLKMGNVDFIERKDSDEILILGDPALETANLFGREARRPLSNGLISPNDSDSLEVLGIMVANVVGKPSKEGEVCYFSVPAAPVDDPTKDVIYHEGVFERILTECGYDPIPGNEAMAVIYSETAKEDFSGIAISFGSGMSNVALALNGIEGLTFSVGQGGDFIDAGAAKNVGSTAAQICAIKEKGINLLDPQNIKEEAISFYYKHLIGYVLDHIAQQFKAVENQFSVPRPIPLIISGGTSKAGGFVEFFTKVFERKRKRFPIEISEIRQAADPLNAVAQGLLIQAMQEED